MTHFSFARTWAVFVKEFQQILRDRLTFGMIVGIPILQLVLFGYAINSDPKQLPTAVVAAEQGPLVRGLVTALQNTGYFRVVQSGGSEADADAAMARGEVQFVIVVPPGFERELLLEYMRMVLANLARDTRVCDGAKPSEDLPSPTRSV